MAKTYTEQAIQKAIEGGWNSAYSKILDAFRDTQCFENEKGGYYFNDDETPLLIYRDLEKQTGYSKPLLRKYLIELRNNQIIELNPAVDSDYTPNGSGWMLSKKGVSLINYLAEGKDAETFFANLLKK